MSMHLEDEAERKTLAFIMNGENDTELIRKKWDRVPVAHKEWLWGKIETKIKSDQNITAEQKQRFEAAKKALKF